MAETCLPGLYPREGMPAHSPESEKKVYKAIADALPAGWYAWHSVKLRSQDGEDAEADFIIAAPGISPAAPDASTARPSSGASSPPPPAAPTPAPPTAGILILEVKGSAISKKDGQWHQAGKPMPKPPRSQAIRSRVVLLSKFDSRGIKSPAIGEAVVFPDQDYKGWAEMIRKVYEVDSMVCPQCGATMRVIAFLTDYAVVDRIINHLKLTFVADKPLPPHLAYQEVLMAAETAGEYIS